MGFEYTGTDLTLDTQNKDERDDRNGREDPSRSSDDTQDAVSTVLKGSGAVLLGLLCRIGLLFLTELIAARYLGPSRYGLLTWGITVISLVSMFTMLGLNSAARRFVPIYRQQGEAALLSGLLRGATVLTASGGFVGMLVLYAAAEPLSLQVLGNPKELPILEVLVIALPFWNLQKTFLALTAGFKRTWVKVMTEDIFVPLGFLTVVSLAALTDHGPRAIAIGYVIVYVVSALIAGLGLRFGTQARQAYTVKPLFQTKKLLGFSWPLILTETLGKATGVVDILLVGILASSADVGVYRVASDLSVTMSVVLMCFGYLYLPTAAEHFARGDIPGWRALNTRIARWVMLVSFPIAAGLFLQSADVLQVVYGANYSAAAPVLKILALGYFVHAMVGFTGSNLVVSGKTRLQLVAHLLALAARIAVAVTLIPRAGVVGAALATVAGILVANGFNLLVTVRHYGMHPFTRSYLRTLAILIVTAVLVHLGIVAVGEGALISLFLFVVGMTLAGLILLRLGLVIDADDRELLQRLLRGKTPS